MLILRGKRVAADLELHRVQYVKRLALGRKRLTLLSPIAAFGRKGNELVGIRDRGETEDVPFVGLGQKKAGQIVDMNTS